MEPNLTRVNGNIFFSKQKDNFLENFSQFQKETSYSNAKGNLINRSSKIKWHLLQGNNLFPL